MNQQASKRPAPSDSKILEPPKKKSKKSKSSSSSKRSSTEKDTANSLERTADAEGITMTTVLSTLSTLEKSRFVAFRRSTFRGDAISTYVAHLLQASNEMTYARNEKSCQLLGVVETKEETKRRRQVPCPYVKNNSSGSDSTFAAGTSSDGTSTQTPSTSTPSTSTIKKRFLKDMVPPGQADEISVVVSTLAKAYAQRLVLAARRVAAAQGVDESTPLSPQQVLTAYHSRVQAGLDPGFFLQKPRATAAVAESSSLVAAALGHNDEYTLARNAALAAQQEYDQYIKEKKEAEGDGNVAYMDVDEEEGKNETTTTSGSKDDESAKKK